MSWSVAGTGKGGAVRTSIADQFAKGSKCVEPEESIRLAVAALLDQTLAGQTGVVQVNANGSQSIDYRSGLASHYLTVAVSPIHGFVE